MASHASSTAGKPLASPTNPHTSKPAGVVSTAPAGFAFNKPTKGKMNATMSPPEAERITLYYREGSSDKVYQASIEPKGELFVVNFAYGRRGSTMNTGTKTSSPVDYETAKNT